LSAITFISLFPSPETLEGAGIALAEQYRDQGLNMLHEHVQFEDGSVSVEGWLDDDA
jgi:hypothetical protein